MTTTVVSAPPLLELPARVSPLAGLRQTVNLAGRTLVQIKHNPMELLDLSLMPLMFVLLFTYVFGGAVSGSPGAYLTFALAGLVVQNALFTTMYTGTGLNLDLQKGVFDRLRSLPIARYAPLTGRILADTLKQTWAITILLGVGMVLGFRIGTGPLGVLGAYGLLLVFTLAFSWVSVLVGALAADPEKVQIFSFVTLMPLTFASGAFVPAETMPGWLQAWVAVNPVTILSDAVRGLLIGGPVAEPVTGSLLWAVGIAVVFAPLALRALRHRV